MSVIVGLDLSLTGTGMCRIEDGKATWAVFGTTSKQPKKEPPVPEHVWEIMRIRAILGKIREFANGATLVAVEEFAFGIQGAGARTNAGLGFVVRYWLLQEWIPFITIGTAQVKKFAVGRSSEKGPDGKMRGVPKEIIIREVFERWGYRVDENNQADAVVLAMAASTLVGNRQASTAGEKAVLVELRKKYLEVCPVAPAAPKLSLFEGR